MMKTHGGPLKYVFPWQHAAEVPSRETFALLDGAIRGYIQRIAADAGETRYAAVLNAYDLGTYPTITEAREAAEHAATTRINDMLATILPPEAKAWLTRPI